jgi:hypothetical protein
MINGVGNRSGGTCNSNLADELITGGFGIQYSSGGECTHHTGDVDLAKISVDPNFSELRSDSSRVQRRITAKRI